MLSLFLMLTLAVSGSSAQTPSTVDVSMRLSLPQDRDTACCAFGRLLAQTVAGDSACSISA